MLASLLDYAALPNEPALSAKTLRLLFRLCHAASRDSELVQAFLYDCSVTQRRTITQGLAAWLQTCAAGDETSGFEEGAGAVEGAALVVRLLLRSLDTLLETVDKKGCEPVEFVRDPTAHGENLAVALLGLYQVRGRAKLSIESEDAENGC